MNSLTITNYELTFEKDNTICMELCNKSNILSIIEYRCYSGWKLIKMKKIKRKY